MHHGGNSNNFLYQTLHTKLIPHAAVPNCVVAAMKHVFGMPLKA